MGPTYQRLGLTILAVLLCGSLLAPPASAGGDPLGIAHVLRCQKRIASQGARFAKITIKNTLKCTNEVVECQINCDQGVYGPPCGQNPPPCCDSQDPNSNAAFGACMFEAEEFCARMDEKIAAAETKKGDSITSACDDLTTEELCGGETEGLSFATLNAGCEALIPGYQCSLPALIDCVGGPLEQQLAEQIAGLLDPRSEEALALTPGLSSIATGIPRTRKVREDLPAGKVDVWAIDGVADQPIKVRVISGDPDTDAVANLDPVLTYLDQDGSTPVGNVNVVNTPCRPNACGASCPAFKRTFPFSGTFFISIQARTSNGCGGDAYTLAVTTAGGDAPTLVADDVEP